MRTDKHTSNWGLMGLVYEHIIWLGGSVLDSYRDGHEFESLLFQLFLVINYCISSFMSNFIFIFLVAVFSKIQSA